MATIQQSIDVNVPVRAAYNHLTQFETYPRFMQDVDDVRQVDDTHLHWTARTADRPVEWDAEITEQELDRCIAWQSTGGPASGGKVEVQALSPDTARVTFTLQADPERMSGAAGGDAEAAMRRRLGKDLDRLKDIVEESAATSAPTSAGTSAATSAATGTTGTTGNHAIPAAAAARHRPAPDPATGRSAVVGAFGGTDAAAGAQLSGSKGGPGGPSPRENVDAAGVPGSPGGMMRGDAISPAAGAGAAGGTGLGEAARADDARTESGTAAGSEATLGGRSAGGARAAGVDSGKKAGRKP